MWGSELLQITDSVAAVWSVDPRQIARSVLGEGGGLGRFVC